MRKIVVRECRLCKRWIPLVDFPDRPTSKAGKSRRCRACEAEYMADYFDRRKREDPKYKLLSCAKIGARNRGLQFTITRSDIALPEKCPYLGIKLDYGLYEQKGRKPDALATLDRIDNSRGYIPGNVQVISLLANRMKTDASLEMLVRFALGVLETHGSFDGGGVSLFD